MKVVHGRARTSVVARDWVDLQFLQHWKDNAWLFLFTAMITISASRIMLGILLHFET
eukprot:CAMPEP_0170187550 /NCGR_PEP_ID=MMETSP0040_2-20121228/42006_1 /TAXON_ID=641309 /ORGANISM="Lotharella oceanica, Strain CCMP622" /LENGTH=56 /DNA_ID=CAMNT_0010434615 /DNA_START=438 /DNA_END=605 /DNA_ORIENTATION=-